MKPTFHWITLLVLLFGHMAWSQTPVYQRFGTHNNLPSNEIYRILQAKDGTMFFGSSMGMLKYDGYQFKVVSTHGFDRAAPPFINLQQSPDGRIFGHLNGDGLYEMIGDTLFKPNDRRRLREFTERVPITAYTFDEDNRVWLVTNSVQGEVYVGPVGGEKDTIRQQSDPEQGPVCHLYRPKGSKKLLGVRDFHGKKDVGKLYNTQWIGKGELLHQSETGWTLQFLHLPWKQSIGIWRISAIESGTNLWLTYGNMLVQKDLISNEERFWKIPGDIYSLQVLKNETALVGGSKGLFVLKKGEEELEHLFQEMIVSSCYEDKEGALWIGTLDKGILYLPSLDVRTLDCPELKETSISKLVKKGNRLAAITNQGDLFIWEDIHQEPIIVQNDEGPLAKTRANDLVFFDGLLWMNSYYFDWKTRKFTQFEFENTIYEFCEIGGELFCSGRFVVGTVTADRKVNWWLDIKDSIDPKVINRFSIRDIVGKDSTIYLGTLTGAMAFDLTSKKRIPGAIPKGIKRNATANFLSIDPSGKLLMATGLGSFLIYPDTTFLAVTDYLKLSSIRNTGLAWESDSVYWVSTMKGLNKVTVANGDYRVDQVGFPHGLIPEATRCMSYHNDSVFVGTDQGILFFNSKTIEHYSLETEVALTSIQINDTQANEASLASLSDSERNVRFNFSAQSYRPGMEVEYSYQLKGLHEEWVESREAFAAYYNLQPGEYEFRVKARNRHGPWSEQQVVLPFSIPPVYYERASFWLLLGTLGFLFLSGLVYWYFRQQNDRRKSNWAFSNAQLQALGLQMNPHFLFNALNSVQALAYARDHLVVNTFIARLSGLTRRVLENSNEPLIPLLEEMTSVEEYLEMEQVRFEDRSIDWTIRVDEGLNPKLKIPPMLLQPIVENAIWHGLLPKESDRKLDIHYSKTPKGYTISICDNGRGFDALAVKQKNDKGSVSLRNIHKRIQLYNKLGYGDASVDIQPLNPVGPDKGTSVKFYFTQTI